MKQLCYPRTSTIMLSHTAVTPQNAILGSITSFAMAANAAFAELNGLPPLFLVRQMRIAFPASSIIDLTAKNQDLS